MAALVNAPHASRDCKGRTIPANTLRQTKTAAKAKYKVE
jgi:hypothetical protein